MLPMPPTDSQSVEALGYLEEFAKSKSLQQPANGPGGRDAWFRGKAGGQSLDKVISALIPQVAEVLLCLMPQSKFAPGGCRKRSALIGTDLRLGEDVRSGCDTA